MILLKTKGYGDFSVHETLLLFVNNDAYRLATPHPGKLYKNARPICFSWKLFIRTIGFVAWNNYNDDYICSLKGSTNLEEIQASAVDNLQWLVTFEA